MISLLLKGLPESSRLEITLFEDIQMAFLRRIKDTRATIRVQAVLGLERLQDPRNPHCAVTEALTYHMHRDVCYLVRQAAVRTIKREVFLNFFLLVT
jgi:hypothetical protein